MFKLTGTRWITAALVGLAATVAYAQGTDAAAGTGDAYRKDPAFVAAVREARESERAKEFGPAIEAYRKANEIAGGKCVACVAGIYGAQMMDGNFEGAIATAKAMGLMSNAPMVRSVAAYDRGRALVARGGDAPKPEQLEEARAAFRESVELLPANTAALFNEGEVLERLGRTEEARKDFETCLGLLKPSDPAWPRVKHFAENPELAKHKLAPAFEVVALDGAKFNLDSMGGRVVLVDFWATWCAPCNAELPELKRIAKEFEGQPFVMISVSSDEYDGVWREFVKKNEMTWVQYRDMDHKLADAFGVSEIPHYFTIDADGVLTSEKMGEGSGVEETLKKLIAKAQEEKKVAGQVGAPKTAGN